MRRWQRRSGGSSPAAGKVVVWSWGHGPAVYLLRGAVRLHAVRSALSLVPLVIFTWAAKR